MLPSNKKVTILCILEILREYSDEDHPLTQAEILKKLYTRYGIECERKSVGASVQSLIDFGCDIKRCGKRGCYLNARELEDSEITFLIDAVFTSKSITEKQAKEVAKKISFIQSQYKRKRYNYICKADEISRTSNKTFFYNLDIIGEAIDNGLQIMFKYNIFGANGKLNRRCEELYTVYIKWRQP